MGFFYLFYMNNKHDKCETTANTSLQIFFPPIGDYSDIQEDSLIFWLIFQPCLNQDEDELIPFDMSIQVRSIFLIN